jgi:RIO kinase 2
MGKRKSASWMYMSRLAAAKEYAFMKILYEHGFPVPQPIDHARHCIVMSFIDAFPLRQIAVLPPEQIPLLYSALMKLIVRLARCGLIHGDFNEFNLLIREVSNASDDDEAPDTRHSPTKAALSNPTHVANLSTDHNLPTDDNYKVEKRNGFERVIVDPAHEASEESDQDGEEEEEEDDYAEEDQVHLADDVTIEPILIDFPQMVSINHENAE